MEKHSRDQHHRALGNLKQAQDIDDDTRALYEAEFKRIEDARKTDTSTAGKKVPQSAKK